MFYIVSFSHCTDDGFEVGVGVGEEEEEDDDEVDPSELQRRKERLEREQWLREQVCISIMNGGNDFTCCVLKMF